MKASVIFVILTILKSTRSEVLGSDAFLDRFRYGIELVHRFFDSDKGYFETFFPFFENKDYNIFQRRTRDDFVNNLLGAIIETIGGSQKEMTKTGIKISVLVAKIISDSFSQTGRDSRSAVNQDFSPLNTLLRQTQVKNLMEDVKDPRLIEKITKEFSSEGNECLQLLFCKISPFVKGMQKSLSFFADTSNGGKGETEERETWAKSKPIERMYLFMPGTGEFLDNCDICDDRYPSCRY